MDKVKQKMIFLEIKIGPQKNNLFLTLCRITPNKEHKDDLMEPTELIDQYDDILSSYCLQIFVLLHV